MKKSLPNIVSYEVLKKEYSNIKLYNPREFFVFTDDDNLPSKAVSFGYPQSRDLAD